jgi:alpha-glucosidase
MIKLLLTLFFCAGTFGQIQKNAEWYEHASFYQIYPRSFKDSDGDGIGDLKGMISHLDHLKDAGMTAFWLSPIFASPQVDLGYDVSDFYKIEPAYGTMEDFDNLVKKAKSLGLKILLDFIPNHTSDKHDWFVKSENKEGEFTDYYIWHDGKPDPQGGSRNVPPNNWVFC